MRICFIFIILSIKAVQCSAQNANASADRAEMLGLSISTPQPRLNQTFQVSIDAAPLRSSIFQPLAGKLKIVESYSNVSSTNWQIDVVAMGRGKQQIGPIEFNLGNRKFTTNTVVYEVIEPLPKSNKGLWFRKVKTSDSTFALIIEQRIPSQMQITKNEDNSITYSTVPESEDIVKFDDGYSLEGAQRTSSFSKTSQESVEIKGETMGFMDAYSVYHFIIKDRKKQLVIKRDSFVHLPPEYKFEDILIE